MLSKIRNHLQHKFTICAFLFITALGMTGCQLLFQLPIIILQLPIRILGMVFQMLPYLIKFAPLALLFIEGENENATSYYAALPHGTPCVMRTEQFACYLVDLADKEQAVVLAEEVERQRGRMVFLKDADLLDKPGAVTRIHDEMRKNELTFAYDERVLNDGGELSQKSFNV